MKVVRRRDRNNLRLNVEPDPIPRVREDLINVKAVGICESDLHRFMEGGIGDDQLNHPLVLGHEFAGISGAGVRVVADPAISCRIRDFCRND
jgi:threonine dehydrogenase-like Zn-dependent dehydrogenase